MRKPNYGPAVMMLLAAVLLFVPKVVDLEKLDWGWINIPIIQENIEGRTLVLVYEQRNQTVEETEAIRSQEDFVASHKLKQFMALDQDDAFATEAKTQAEAQGVSVPFLMLVSKDGESYKVHKIKPFSKGLGDIL